MKLTKRPSWALGALAAGASIAVTIGLATPARAALSGTDWTSVPLSDGVTQGIADGPAVHPVSCVSGTTFCVAIVGDMDNIVNGSDIGQAALVTTDAGQTWSTNVTLPSTVFPITALSCVTTSVCWASGYSSNGGPGVAESTDGGLHWSDRTPSTWASDAHWSPNSIDCVSATTCWMAGSSLFGYTPSVVSTTDGGADWTVFGNLPQFPPDSNGYVLQAISCVTAVSCVAVGGQYGGSSMAAVISTTDGGTTWALSASPALNRVQQLIGLSCLPGRAGNVVCYAGGATFADKQGMVKSVALISRTGGASWRRVEVLPDNGWLSSVSCATTRNCWAAGAGSANALTGTANRGASWSTVTSDTTNEVGSVSCLSVSTCVAVTDNGVWVTSDDGGLTPAS